MNYPLDSLHPVSSNHFSPKHLVVLDRRVRNLDGILRSLDSTRQFLLLAPDRDGIEQITEALAVYPAACLSVVAAAFDQGLYLGNSTLGLDTLKHYTVALRSWFAGVGAPTLNLLACPPMANDQHQKLLEQLSTLTGATLTQVPLAHHQLCYSLISHKFTAPREITSPSSPFPPGACVGCFPTALWPQTSAASACPERVLCEKVN